MAIKKIALIGNCQVQSLAALVPLMIEGCSTVVLDYSTPESRQEPVRAAFADTIADCDVILAQPAVLSMTSERDLRSRYPGKTCIVANFYFRGLFPDSCYVGSFGERFDRPMAVNSIIVLDAFLRGLSVEQAVASFEAESYHRLGLFDAWSSSMAEMRNRDVGAGIDVPAADFMEQACRTYPAFLTMNHPSAVFLADYLVEVFRSIGAAHTRIDASRVVDPLSLHDTTPIDDVVAEHYGLPYRVPQKWSINSVGNRFIGREEVVARFYAAYADAERRKLTAHSPTDMVRFLQSKPDLRYLVSDEDPTEEAAPRRAGLRPNADSTQFALADILTGIAEIRIFTHKVHSFAETSDPKVERILHLTEHQLNPEQTDARLVRRFAETIARTIDEAGAVIRDDVERTARRTRRMVQANVVVSLGLFALILMMAWIGAGR